MGSPLAGLAFAFSAGVFSIFSPCSYALLPGYVSYYLGSRFSVGRAVSGGLACTLGLMTVFTVIGGLASSLGELLPQIVPLLDLLAGVMLIAMGVVTLKQVQLPYPSIDVRLAESRGYLGLYIFGVVYGLAGVGCSAPIFLSILFYAMSKGLGLGVLTFLVYALGMGVPLIVTSVLLANAKDYVVSRLSQATGWLHKVSGVVLILVGLYLFYFYYITYVG
jgi:cytochrome c-type biogenesis protein